MSQGAAQGTSWTRLRRWLRPGIGIKRWLLVMFLGLTILATAGALVIRLAFREVPADSLAGQLFDLVSLNFLPGLLRPLVAIAAGVALFAFGLWRLLGVLLEPFPARREPLVELVYQKRSLARGPRIVAIGGGTGLSTLLRGLKEMSSNITAIVTVADDGGSSGKLRQELGVPPDGRHPQLHRRPGGRGARHDEPHAVSLPGQRRRARARRARLREPAHRGHGRHRRRLRGGRPPGQPRPRGARPGRARRAGGR